MKVVRKEILRLTCQHVRVGSITNAEDVRRDFSSSLSLVHVDDTRGVDGIPFVGIDSNAEKSRVSL